MEQPDEPVDVIVLAAGRGKRMQAAINKIFLPVAEIPVLYRTLAQFQRCDCIRSIYVVCQAEEKDDIEKVLKQHGALSKFAGFIDGGKERADSVRKALLFYQQKGRSGMIMIHDGARPFFSGELLGRLIQAAGHSAIAVPVQPVVETVRKQRTRDTVVVDRKDLFLAQTPQVFHSDWINPVFFQSSAVDAVFTDDASFFEAAGQPVKMVMGERWNIKITVPEDLAWAAAVLSQFPFLDIEHHTLKNL